MKRIAIALLAAVAACSPSPPSEPIASVAEPLTVIPDNGGTFTGSTAANAPGVTNQYGGTCGGGSAREQVYQWRAPRSGTATFATCGSSYDTVLYVRKSTITGSELGCNDDAASCAVDASRLSKAVVACTTYFIFVDGWSTTSGAFTLTVTPPSGTGSTCAQPDASSDAAQEAAADVSQDGASDGAGDVATEETGTEASDGTTSEAGSDGSGESGDIDGSSGETGDSNGADDGSGPDGDEGSLAGDAGEGGDGGPADASDASAVGLYPLRKQAGARYLVDQAGNPFLIHGDSAWSLIANLTDENAETFLADRQAKGVNTLVVNLIEHHFSQNPPADAYGHQPFAMLNGFADFSAPNEAYFAHADSVIQRAAAHGIQLLLFPCYFGDNGGGEGWYADVQANGPTKMAAYGQWVGARYRSFANILWVAAGDFSPDPTTLLDAIANGIKATDDRHLMTGHGSSWTGSASGNWAGKPWLDFDAVYWRETGGAIGSVVLATYNRATPMPTFLIESGYENELTTAAELRRQAYESILNGGMGQVWGNAPIWCFYTNGTCIYAGPTDWRQQLNSAGAQDQVRLRSLFAPRPWWKLVPQTFLTAGGSGASVERANDATWGAAYFPSSRAITVNLASFAQPVSGSWFNPSTGAFTQIAGSPFVPSGSVTTSPPSSGDWVVVFE